MPYDGPAGFVHLHVHSVYSLLDGVATPDQMFAECKTRGWPALAITEHGNLASMPDAHFASIEHGIKYIPGIEMYFNDSARRRDELVALLKSKGFAINQAKDSGEREILDIYDQVAKNRHITILAKNAVGVRNLICMATDAWQNEFRGYPRITFDDLIKFKDGLIVLSGCLNGLISHEIRKYGRYQDFMAARRDSDAVKKHILKFRELFGDDFYIELQMPCLPHEDGKIDDYMIFWILNSYANEYGIKKVLTNDTHYMSKSDAILQRIMMATKQKTSINDPELFYSKTDEQYFKTRAELWDTFKSNKYHEHVKDWHFNDMCDNTLEVARKCETYTLDKSPKVPNYENAYGKLVAKVKSELAKRGLNNIKKRYLMDNRMVTYTEQAAIELRRIENKNFSSYFLITEDLVNHSVVNMRSPVGPRGSVGGSLVCYLLGITSLDPLAWGLSFDRFLSESRGGKLLNIKLE
jgi:DNA polymerase-3 subunit alpha